MGFRLPLLLSSLLAACGSSRVEHVAALEFGDVAVGQSRRVALELKNQGTVAVALTFEATGDFTIDEASRTLAPNEDAILLVRFSPTDVGARSGTLAMHSASGTAPLSLSGRGTGARLTLPPRLVFAPVTLVAGQPAAVATATLVVRNTGTAGSLLKLEPPRVDGAELCIGSFTNSTCTRWVPPASLDTQTFLEVPISLLATTPGPRQWSLVFPSDDPLHAESSVEVVAFIEAVEPCVFSAPAEVVLVGTTPGLLTLTHTGRGRCLVRDVSLSSTPAGFLEFVGDAPLPLRLEGGERLTRLIGLRPAAPLQLTGTVHVVAAGTASLEVPVRREGSAPQCLVLSPSMLDLGAVLKDCNSPTRNVQIYNSCATSLTVATVEIALGAEFFLVSGITPGTVLMPGSPMPATFSVKYRPLDSGLDRGAVRVRTLEGGDFILALEGRSDVSPPLVDTFRQDAPSLVDLLVLVDPSPSFVPKRAGVRANLSSLLNQVNNGCFDLRCGIAPADGAPGAGVRLLTNDAGTAWASTRDPLFVERALAAFDSLPIGSETEACIGPAADLVQDAGLRPGTAFTGLCVTDALEHSLNPAAALQALQSRQAPSPVFWSAITGLGSACAVEAIDDGVHRSLVNAAYGLHEDVCNPTWWQNLVGLTGRSCPVRTQFYLTSPTAGPLEVRIDGQLVPDADWTLDVRSNSVLFSPGRAPAPGATLQITYALVCVP